MSDDTKGPIFNELDDALSKITGAHQAVEIMSYSIWGAAASTTRAFEKVTMRIDPNTNRIFVSIRLRWWAKYEKFRIFRDGWLRRARERCREQCPEGWKLLVYYDGGTNGK